MAILNVLIYPNTVLTKKASPVTKIDARLKNLARDMIDTMYQEEGVGLAAPQIGVSKQIIVISPNARKGEERVLLNPEITYRSSEKELGSEGCLSVPDLAVNVSRSKVIRFRAMILDGSPIEEEACDFPARVIQHEVDHLNGILLVDYADFDQRQEFAAKTSRRL